MRESGESGWMKKREKTERDENIKGID